MDLKNQTLRKLFFLVTLLLNVNSFAQQDTEFWFAAPDVSSAEGESPVLLNLTSYSNAATVTISQPANGAFSPIVVNLGVNAYQSVDLTPFIVDIESAGANIIDDSGIKISSTSNISVTYEVNNANNREIFSLKGSKGLGTDFYTPFQKFWNNAVVSPATFSSFDIVATQNNTTIAITPRTNIVGHSMNTTFTVVLNTGETYSARDMNVSASTSLAGSIVAADKPVSVTVFSGALLNNGCTSSVGEQLVTTDNLGTNFIVRKSTAANERIYILAINNSTSISIINSGTTNSLINWGETYEYVLTDNINYIETTQPVYVLHVSGNGCNLGMTILPPVYCSGKYEQNFTRNSTDSLGLMVYIRSGFENQFQIDGNSSLLTASDFAVVPGTSGEFVSALKFFNISDISTGNFHQLTNAGDVFGLGVINGQSGNGSAYSFVSEFQSYPYVNAGTDATVCANSSFPVNGIVGGGSVTGIWGGNGFGDWDKGLDTLSNTYFPSNLDTIISPIYLILTSTGPCPVQKDTLTLTVTPAPIINAGANQTVCANNSDVSLSGTVTGGATGGIWSTLGSGNFSPNNTTLNAIYTPSASDITLGTVSLVLTSTGSGSCVDETDTMSVLITPAPIVDISVDTIYVCSNNASFNLSGTVTGGSTTGKWVTAGAGLFNPDNLSLNTAYYASPQDVNLGQMWIYLESTNNNNCSIEKDSVLIVFTPSPQVNAGSDIQVCTNLNEVNLSGLVSGPTTTGQWSGGSGNYSANNTDLNAIYIPTATEVSAGNLVLTLTSTNNGTCTAESDNVLITFIAPPFANFNYTNACEFDTTYFTDFSLNGYGSIVNWSWDFGDGTTGFTTNDDHIYSNFGSYDVQLIVESSAGCKDTTVKTVNVYDKPIADFNYTSTCNNDQVIFSFTDQSSTNTGNITSYYYDFGGQGNQSSPNPTQLFLGIGNFTITEIIQTDQGCSDTITQVINIPPKPVAGFIYDSNNGLNIGAEFNFIDTSLYAVDWNWDLGNGESSTDQNPTTTYFENGIYNVTQWVTSSTGCSDSITISITINTVTNEISQLIPNAISPNGDGKNDIWKLDFIKFLHQDAEIIVVNRWGQTIFQSIGYDTPWDGTYQGDLVPEGTYYYIIKLSADEVYKGTVLVLKSANN
jgi:gliding motility-associated-like protein